MESIDKMLGRLGTDYIDLLLLHQQFGDYLGAWRDMEKAVAQGKVRSIGLSNFESERLEEVLTAANIKPAVLQVECHPYYQQAALKERIADAKKLMDIMTLRAKCDDSVKVEFEGLDEQSAMESIKSFLKNFCNSSSILYK